MIFWVRTRIDHTEPFPHGKLLDVGYNEETGSCDTRNSTNIMNFILVPTYVLDITNVIHHIHNTYHVRSSLYCDVLSFPALLA